MRLYYNATNLPQELAIIPINESYIDNIDENTLVNDIYDRISTKKNIEKRYLILIYGGK